MDRVTIRAQDEDLVEVPVITGTEGEQALGIAHLRKATGLVTLDPGYGNTAEASSAITFINGEDGILRYRGYPVDQLVEHSSFLEVCYLLDQGELPSPSRLTEFEQEIRGNASLPEGLMTLLEAIPASTHPMQKLAAVVAVMGSYYPGAGGSAGPEGGPAESTILLAKLPVLAAWSYRSGTDGVYIEPRSDLGYASNFLNMMFAPQDGGFEAPEAHIRALEALLLLHADHGQNLSTSAVRLVGSSRAELFSAISAGILALSGPLHGGANQRVVEMLEEILAAGGDTRSFIERAKDRSDPFRLMGFGHRVYKNYDPRAELIKQHAKDLLRERANPLLETALRLETEALEDEFFIQRGIYPNVDFYSGIIYRAIGFPSRMFTVLFALGRLPGWLAQWREMIDDPYSRIKRPRSIYLGSPRRDFVPIEER